MMLKEENAPLGWTIAIYPLGQQGAVEPGAAHAQILGGLGAVVFLGDGRDAHGRTSVERMASSNSPRTATQ